MVDLKSNDVWLSSSQLLSHLVFCQVPTEVVIALEQTHWCEGLPACTLIKARFECLPEASLDAEPAPASTGPA